MRNILHHTFLPLLFIFFLSGCEVGITPLDYGDTDPSVGVTVTEISDIIEGENGGTILEVGNVPPQITLADIVVELTGVGSDNFETIVALNNNIFTVDAKPIDGFTVREDTTFNLLATVYINDVSSCVKSIVVTLKGTNRQPVITINSTTAVFTEDAAAADDEVVAFSTSDEDLDTVTVALSDESNYALSGNSVVLTIAGAVLVNSGADLPAFMLIPNDGRIDGNTTTVTPPATSDVNDLPLITVTASSITEDSVDTTTVVASSDTVDEDDTFFTYTKTAGTDTDNYYVVATDGSVTLSAGGVAFVNAGGTLLAVDVTVTTGSSQTANDTDTPTITPFNDAPVTYDRNVSLYENTSRVIILNGDDEEGALLTYYIESNVSHGTIVIDGDEATYTPTVGYFGPDSFTFVVNDGDINSSVATVNISVIYVDTTAPVITLLGANPQIIEAGTAYTELNASTNDGTAVVIDISAVDTNTEGNYTVTYNATDTAGNPATEKTRTVQVVDTTAPVITLLGANPQIIEAGTAYTELNASTNDGTAVVIDISAVDTNTEGNYTVTYNATDTAGNPATEKTRTVQVVDTTAPVITLLGANPQIIEAGTAYTELNASTNDGTAVVIDISAVDTNTEGNYTVTYNATDTAGNPATEKTRTVQVVDTTAPVITLLGANPQIIEAGTAYTELNASTNDGTAVVIDISAVDTNTEGNYTVTYNATDTAGNPATEKTRTVQVVDTTAPVITLLGANPQIIEAGTAYTELNASTNDGTAVVIDISAVDTNTEGNYTVTYNATDTAGNPATEKTRTVQVVDTTAPVITLLGANPQIIEAGTAYTELNASTNDGTAVVIDISAVDTNTEGNYTVTYNATDTAGNPATEKTRTVQVVDTTAPVITLLGANPQIIEAGTAYTELNASTNDGTAVVIDISAVDTNTEGNYTVTYNATDTAGNPATEKTRTVQVVDTTAPVITLLGANPQIIEAGTAYTELNASTNDGTAVVIDISAVDTNTEGNYTVTYNATDTAGNPATEKTRTVQVVDTTAPVITLLGANPQIIEAGTAYTELNASTNDGTAVVIDISAVDTNTEGNYTVTYNATDTAGNPATEKTRTVQVVDTTAPVITLLGANPQIIEAGTAYTELNASTNDGTAVVIDISAVDTNTEGNYTVTYNATDTAGNPATEKTRTVNVVVTPYLFAWCDDTNGTELWRSDGTDVNATLVKDISITGSSNPTSLTKINTTYFFSADDNVSGVELWKSDGTASGTVLVKDIYDGNQSASPSEFVDLHGTLFFTADDGVNGRELWKSDGTFEGTVMVYDIHPLGDSNPMYLTNVNGTLFFAADDGAYGVELWKSDGTASGTIQVEDLFAGIDSAFPSYLAVANNLLFFNANNGSGRTLWTSDGNVTQEIMSFDEGIFGPTFITSVDDKVFFRAYDHLNRTELWSSDGTDTLIVKDINTDYNAGSIFVGHSLPFDFTDVNGTLYFTAIDKDSAPRELWKSDGTEAGTVKLIGAVTQMISANGKLYFIHTTGDHKRFYKDDESGTAELFNFKISDGTADIIDLRADNGIVYFRVLKDSTPDESWAYDTVLGTWYQIAIGCTP